VRSPVVASEDNGIISGERQGIGDRGGRCEELPGEVVEAIREYLVAAGRWEGIRPQDYIFAPSADPFRHEAGCRPEDWDASRHLKTCQINYLLQRYAWWAGLKVDKINTTTLRNTAVVRLVEAGMSVKELHLFLGGEICNEVIRLLVHALKAKPQGVLTKTKKPRWKKGQVPERGPNKPKPGEQRALKHGLYARTLPEVERAAACAKFIGKKMTPMDWEIIRRRYILRHALEMTGKMGSLAGEMRLLNGITLAALRIAKLVLARERLRVMLLTEKAPPLKIVKRKPVDLFLPGKKRLRKERNKLLKRRR
jgi:hypothetical protein